MPERSFFIADKQFPVCARCTGAFIGYCIGGITYFFFKLPIFLSLSFCAIMFIDWAVQEMEILKSNNLRRLLTGFLCGFALMQIYIDLIIFVVCGIAEKLQVACQ